MLIVGGSPLESLPNELLVEIFSYIYPKWHLSDTDSHPQSQDPDQRRHNQKLEDLEVPGIPVSSGPEFSPVLICKRLYPIVCAAYLTSFTGHVFIGHDETVKHFESWKRYQHAIKTISISITWERRIFEESPRAWLDPTGKTFRIYYPKNFHFNCIHPISLQRILHSTWYDSALTSGAKVAFAKVDGIESLRSLEEPDSEFHYMDNWAIPILWCSVYDLIHDPDGFFIFENGVRSGNQFYRELSKHFTVHSKRYVSRVRQS